METLEQFKAVFAKAYENAKLEIFLLRLINADVTIKVTLN